MKTTPAHASDALTFRAKDGCVAMQAGTVKTIVECDDGCTVITAHGSHKVTGSFDEVVLAVWPIPAV